MAVQMFCAELNGELDPAYIAIRKDAVRYYVGSLFDVNPPDTKGWQQARKAGWRIVKVRVEKLEK